MFSFAILDCFHYRTSHPLRLQKVTSELHCLFCLMNVLRLWEKQLWGNPCVSYRRKVYPTNIISKKNMLLQYNKVTLFTLMTQINICPFIWPQGILGRSRDFPKYLFNMIPLLSYPLFWMLAFVYSTDGNSQIDVE